MELASILTRRTTNLIPRFDATIAKRFGWELASFTPRAYAPFVTKIFGAETKSGPLTNRATQGAGAPVNTAAVTLLIRSTYKRQQILSSGPVRRLQIPVQPPFPPFAATTLGLPPNRLNLVMTHQPLESPTGNPRGVDPELLSRAIRNPRRFFSSPLLISEGDRNHVQSRQVR
jgi:hypothetical protein